MRIPLRVMLVLLLLCSCAGDDDSTRPEIPPGVWLSLTECGRIMFIVTDDSRHVRSVTFSTEPGDLTEYYVFGYTSGGWPIDDHGEFEIAGGQALNDVTFRGQFSQDGSHATGILELPSGQRCDWRAEPLPPSAQPSPESEPVTATGRIVFQSDRDGDQEIYVMNADGSDQANLTGNPASDQFPAWSPDGNRIAFFSDRDGDDEIYLMNSDGSNQTQLTHNSAGDMYPAWSPDGTRIAFVSDRDGNREVYTMNMDGSAQTNLTRNPANDGSPNWSPDGKWIAFASNRGESIYLNLYRMNVDGSGLIGLTSTEANDSDPEWSPDGSRIAFVRFTIVDVWICVMDAGGTGHRDIADGSRPSWSPDGNLIVFSHYLESNHNSEIYIMRPDGSGQTMLTDNPACDRDPDWTP